MILRNCCSATSMPAAVQRLRMSPSCQRFTLRCVLRTISIIDSQGFVEHSVLASCPSIPRRVSVSVSAMPSRSEPAASGHVWSSSEASRSSRCSASSASVSDHAARIRERTWSRSRSGSRSVTFRSLWRWHRWTRACSPKTSWIARLSALPPSMTNRIAWSRSRPRSTRSASNVRASGAFSVLPSQSPSGILTPSVVMPSALGITTDGVKIPLGLWEGSTENAPLARTLLADLVDRGLDRDQAILFVIDGGKALRRAIQDVFGEHALVHRCHRHKERNVTDLLPERDRDQVRSRMRAAWSLTDAELAEQRLELLASELDQTWPDAAGSLREGMADTLTLTRLGIDGQLAKTLCSTNPCESMIEIVRNTQRNVKRWQDGDMRKRWTAAGMLVAEQQFRRIIGYKDLAKLVIASDRQAIRAAEKDEVRHEVREPVTV